MDFRNERTLRMWKECSLEICSGLKQNTLLGLKDLTPIEKAIGLLCAAVAWAGALLTILKIAPALAALGADATAPSAHRGVFAAAVVHPLPSESWEASIRNIHPVPKGIPAVWENHPRELAALLGLS